MEIERIIQYICTFRRDFAFFIYAQMFRKTKPTKRIGLPFIAFIHKML